MKSDEIEKAILGAANPQEKDIIRRVVLAGSQMLFDEKAHKPMFAELLGGEGDVGRKLGDGIAHVLLVLYDKSRGKSAQPQEPAAPPAGLINAQAAPQAAPAAPEQPKAPATMPKGALAPAGTILLAKVADFSGKAGLAQVDDAAMNTALQAMFVKIYDRFDPTFRDKVARETGGGQPPQEQPGAQPGLINSNAGGV